MLRISVQETEHATVVRLEGSLIGPWVQELTRVARPLLQGPRRVELELSEVTFVSAAGEQALRTLIASGASLLASSSFVTTLLNMESPE